MDLWKILNSPIILTIVSFIFGGILASAISASWQRRSQNHSVRLVLAQEVLKSYHNYLRYLKSNSNFDDTEDFDEIHSEMLSRCGMAKVIFNEAIAFRLQKLANKLATVHDLRKKAHKSEGIKVKRAHKKVFGEVLIEARSAIEEMFAMLK